MMAYQFIRDSGNETSQMNLSAGVIAKFKLPIPPLAEQRAITARLDAEATNLDSLQAEAEHAIELLKERRAALISAAITGKIDVRNV
jgi:type I restriction enzyme S subunit